jgi:hypothetical protein
MEDLKTKMMIDKMAKGEEVLFEDDRSLDDIIQEIANEEGMTFEQTMAMFKKGLKMAQGRSKVDSKKKAKNRAKNKQAKASRKRNR